MRQKLLFIIKTFRLLRQHRPWRLLLIFVLTMVQGVTSGFSIVLLIPLLQLLNIGGGEQAEGIALMVRRLAESVGIEITIGSILAVYMALLTFSALIQYWKSILDARYQQTFIYSIRRRLFRKIIMADWQQLNSRSKTNHLQVLTREVPNLAAYYFYYLRLLTTVIMTGAYTAYALLISARFTLVIIGVGVIMFFAMRRFLQRSFRLGQGYVDSYNRLLKYIDDFWQTVKIAKVHSSEDYYYNRFDEASTSLLNMEYRMQKNWSVPQLIQRIAGLVLMVAIVWFGYRSGSTPMASFVILILLFSRIFPQLIAMNTDISMIVANVPSVQLVMKLDEELPEPGESSAATLAAAGSTVSGSRAGTPAAGVADDPAAAPPRWRPRPGRRVRPRAGHSRREVRRWPRRAPPSPPPASATGPPATGAPGLSPQGWRGSAEPLPQCRAA